MTGTPGAAFRWTLLAKVALAGAARRPRGVHDFVLGPRLAREAREGREQRTRPLLVAVGAGRVRFHDRRAAPRCGPHEAYNIDGDPDTLCPQGSFTFLWRLFDVISSSLAVGAGCGRGPVGVGASSVLASSEPDQVTTVKVTALDTSGSRSRRSGQGTAGSPSRSRTTAPQARLLDRREEDADPREEQERHAHRHAQDGQEPYKCTVARPRRRRHEGHVHRDVVSLGASGPRACRGPISEPDRRGSAEVSASGTAPARARYGASGCVVRARPDGRSSGLLPSIVVALPLRCPAHLR